MGEWKGKSGSSTDAVVEQRRLEVLIIDAIPSGSSLFLVTCALSSVMAHFLRLLRNEQEKL